MRLEYQQNLRMEQRLIQSPQMIQAMQILQLTTPELRERIEAELLENPFLEVDEGTREAPGEEGDGRPAEPIAEETVEGVPVLEDVPRLLDLPGRELGRAREPTAEFDALQNLAARDAETSDWILSELRVEEPPPEEVEAAEIILASLDTRGFLPEGLEALAGQTGLPLERLERVREKLRRIAHPALGAENLREGYLLQLAALPDPDRVAEALVRDHFDELLANRLPQIAKSMGVGLEQLRKAMHLLGTLDARPLDMLEPDPTMPLVPDILVEPAEDGGYEVILARDGLPEVRLTEGAREALDRVKGDKRMHDFLLKKIERARWFLDAIGQRRQTLLKIAREIVKRQAEFLDFGLERLKPLKMQEVADAVGVHISTVSRAIRGKYAQTPQGILPLKGLFSGGQRTASGGQRSRVSIQERIREIIDAEDKQAPLSDEEIVRILRERDGVKVARRTVTKYRIALEIPSSTLRRSY